MKYLEHIIISYHTHYHVNIEQMEAKPDMLEVGPQELFHKLFIKKNKEEDMSIKSSTAGNS
jgi:hypothetical protein